MFNGMEKDKIKPPYDDVDHKVTRLTNSNKYIVSPEIDDVCYDINSSMPHIPNVQQESIISELKHPDTVLYGEKEKEKVNIVPYYDEYNTGYRLLEFTGDFNKLIKFCFDSNLELYIFGENIKVNGLIVKEGTRLFFYIEHRHLFIKNPTTTGEENV